MHFEHLVHVPDVGCVEVKRLVELLRVLGIERAAYDVWRQGGCSVGRRLRMQRVQGKARLESGRRVREECTLNISPMPVTRDVSKLTG